MSAVLNIVPRTRPLTAMRVLLGTTTKGDILAFCPRANVGAGSSSYEKDAILASSDIRWVMVPHNGTLWDQLNNDGDWIVQVAPGHYVIKSDTDFHREYVIA